MKLKLILVACLCASHLILVPATAANGRLNLTAIKKVYENKTKLHLKSMYILGGWALLNVGVGAIQLGRTSGETHCIYRMGFFFNLVSLGLVGMGILMEKNQDPPTSLGEISSRIAFSEHFHLIMMGLDFSYIGVGFLLNELSKTPRAQQSRDDLAGYGKGLIIQGAVLLVLDFFSSLSLRSNAGKYHSLLNSVRLTDRGMEFRIAF